MATLHYHCQYEMRRPIVEKKLNEIFKKKKHLASLSFSSSKKTSFLVTVIFIGREGTLESCFGSIVIFILKEIQEFFRLPEYSIINIFMYPVRKIND